MEALLYLVHRIPFPPNKGDKVRSYHLLCHLARRYRVFLGTFVDNATDMEHIAALREMCAELRTARLHPWLASMSGLVGLASGDPLTLPYYRNRKIRSWIEQVIERERISRAVVFSSTMMQYVTGRPGLRVVADFVDVDSDKWSQYAATKRWPVAAMYARESRKLLAFERATAASTEATIFVSPTEAELFAQIAPECAGRVYSIANGVDTVYFDPNLPQPSPYPLGEAPVVFTGAMDYWPNVDAVSWFVREVLPTIASANSAVRFYIIGMNPTSTVRALAQNSRVVVTGRVPDVRPYLRHAHVVVAPIRIGRGIQNKILEGMAMARAVVATPACTAALTAQTGIELELGERPEAFAQQVLALLADSTRRDRLGAAARRRVLLDYGWERNLAAIDPLLDGSHSVGDSSADALATMQTRSSLI